MSDPTPPTSTVAPPQSLPAAPPRRRKRRWLLRIVVGGIVLVVLVGVLAQAVLWSDLPRRIAEAQVSRILGVRASVGAVQITWGGHTQVRDVALTLPMESQPFVHIGTLDVQHTALPMIAFAQELRSVTVDDVQLDLRQDPVTRRWNLQQLVPPGNASATQSTSPPDVGGLLRQLPNVHASNIRVSATRFDGKRIQLDDIGAVVTRAEPLTATLDAHVGANASVQGRLALVSSAAHELNLTVDGPPPQLAEFLGATLPKPLSLRAHWTGRRTADGVSGVLQLDRAAVDQASMSGRVDVTANPDGLELRPSQLRLTWADGKLADVRVASGRLLLSDQLRIDSLRGQFNGGTFVTAGSIDPATFVGDLRTEWDSVVLEAFEASGKASFQTRRAFDGKLLLNSDVQADTRVPGGTTKVALSVEASAASLAAVNATVHLQPVTFQPDAGEPIVAPAVTAKLARVGTSIQLSPLSLQETSRGSLAIYGAFDLRDRFWWTTIDTSSLALEALQERGLRAPIDLSVAASGSLTRADVQHAYARVGAATVWANGSYVLNEPRPLQLSTWAWYDKPVSEDENAQLNNLRAVGTVRGTLLPRDVSIEADVDANQLTVLNRPLGDLSMHVTADVNENDATLRSQELDLFGGHWTLNGSWTRNSGLPPTVVATFRNLSLAQLAATAGQSGVSGTVDQGVATVRLASSRLDKLDLTMTASGTSLASGPAAAEAFKLEATLRNGVFHLMPTAQQGDGRLSADVRGDVGMTQPIVFSATLKDWPELSRAATQPAATAPATMPTAPAGPRPRGSVELAGKLQREPTGLVNANVGLKGSIERGEHHLASFAMDASSAGRVLNVERVYLETLDGTLHLNGQLDTTQVNSARFDARFERLTPATLEWVNPLLSDFHGQLAGTLSVAPSDAARPLGPLGITLAVRPEQAGFRSVDLGDIDLNAYVDFTSPQQFRIVTGKSSIKVAGGLVQPFARLTRDSEVGFAQLVTVNFSDLDLDQLARAVDDDGKQLVGRLGGNVKMFGRATTLGAVSGTADIAIDRSDLANFGPIAALYNVLSVGTAGVDPTGSGNVSVRLAEGVLTLDDAHYFNRGVDAKAYGRVGGLQDLMQATPDVTLIGSLQPLRAIKLPLFGDINDVFAAAQSSVTALQVQGTLKDPKVRQVSLTEVGSAVKRMLVGSDGSSQAK